MTFMAIKVTQISKDFNMKSKDILDAFKELGLEKKSGASVESEEYAVGNFSELSVNEAVKKATSEGVSYQIVGNGDKVVSQMPPSGDLVNKATCTVYLYTENGGYSDTVMPNLIGLDAALANKEAARLGLNLKIVGHDGAQGSVFTVTEQSIPPGERIKRGQILIIRLADTGFLD